MTQTVTFNIPHSSVCTLIYILYILLFFCNGYYLDSTGTAGNLSIDLSIFMNLGSSVWTFLFLISLAELDPMLLNPFLLQVMAVSKKEKVKQRPQALNTVEMLRVASSALGRFIST